MALPGTLVNHFTDTHRGLAMVSMVVSSIVISFGGLLMRSLEQSTALDINFYRSWGLLGAVIMILLLRYRGNSFNVIRHIGRIGIVGGVLLALAGMCHIQAMSHTTIANAMFVLGAIPFFAALFARIILGEKLRRSTLITMLIAAAGLGVMVSEGIAMGALYGNLMAILTAIAFALYAVIVRKKRQQEMLPTLLVSSTTILLISGFASQGDPAPPVNDILLCLFWGAALSGVANYLFIFAARHLAAAESALFMLLEFALAPIWVWWFIGEAAGRWTIAGGILIIAAVAIRALVELSHRPKPEQTRSGPI